MSRICVIGAGIAGLVTAKTIKAKGHSVVLVERSRNLGGVWDPDRSYPDVTTQTNRNQYSFSDYPMPADYPEWPDGRRVYQYLCDYAKENGIANDILYDTEVTRLRYDASTRIWSATLTNGSTSEETSFDYVAVCTGIFNRAQIPECRGESEFAAAGGEIFHSSEVNDPSIFTGKRVIVVGFQKSATDVAFFSSQNADTTALVYRNAMWKVPRFLVGLINYRYIIYSRAFGSLFKKPLSGTGKNLLYATLRPSIWLFWRVLEQLLKAQLSLRRCGLVPKHRIEGQVSCALSIAPDGYYEAIRSGRIAAHHSTIERFEAGSVVLANGETLPADVVVFATGWAPTLPFLDEDTLNHVLDPDGNFRLYRNIIVPEVPGLGFVGYNSSLYCQLTSEVAAAWLGELWDGHLTIPSEAEMADIVEQRIAWLHKNRPSDLATFRNTCTAPYEHHYLDGLLTDLGLRKRKTRNWLAETFKPLDPGDYQVLLAPIRPVAGALPESAARPRRIYP